MSNKIDLYDTFPISMVVDKKKKGAPLIDSSGIESADLNLVCEVDATHSGTLINNRIYPPDSMKKGIKSWTKPFKKPVLLNHDEHGEPVGRVIGAKYIPTSLGDGSREYRPILKPSEGYGFTRLTVRINDASTIQKVLDGRYETVSVRMSTNKAICSICDTDWSKDGMCEHYPGEKYDGKLAYVTTGDLVYREVSFVNIPADEFAGVKEAVLSDEQSRPSSNLRVYFNSAEDKVLSDISCGEGNLYDFLDDEQREEDELVMHLLDKSHKANGETNKEDSVKVKELTKDQLKDLELVQELVNEAVDAKLEEALSASKSEYEDAIKKIQEESFKNRVAKEDYEKVKDELDALKASKGDASDSDGNAVEKTEQLEGKIAELEDQLEQKEKDSKIILDENIRLSTDLHNSYAERLYDLKHSLKKPDVSNVTTPDGRDERIKELADRSMDSIKDQIKDLLLEKDTQETEFVALNDSVENPGVTPSDKTNEHEDSSKEELPKSKKGILNKLFN